MRQSYYQLKNKALDELRVNARSKHIRDGYREVTLLALMFFGESHPIAKNNQVKFRTIINPSNARFMATVIQGLEYFLFRNPFEWDSHELMQMKHNLERFAKFCALIYIRYWKKCSNLFNAPINDLNFLQDLQIIINILTKTQNKTNAKSEYCCLQNFNENIANFQYRQ